MIYLLELVLRAYMCTMLSRTTLIHYVLSQIWPKYCSVSWQIELTTSARTWHCSIGSRFSLLRLQKWAARIDLKNFDYESSFGVELIKCLGWQRLEQWKGYYLATQIYKCVHDFAHKLLCDLIAMVSDVNEENT